MFQNNNLLLHIPERNAQIKEVPMVDLVLLGLEFVVSSVLVVVDHPQKIAPILNLTVLDLETAKQKFANVLQTYAKYNQLPICRPPIQFNNNHFSLQIRLDFGTFVITGPTTVSTSISKLLGGQVFSTDGVAVALTGNCATDDFSVSNAPGIPQICGTLTGDHGKDDIHVLLSKSSTKSKIFISSLL